MGIFIVVVLFVGVCFIDWSRPKPVRDRVANPCLDDVIDDIAQRIRSCSYEIMFIIDQNGVIIFVETQYTSNFAALSPDQEDVVRAAPGMVNIHNHKGDIPPSIKDLLDSARLQLSRIIIVSPNYRYTVMPSPDGWRDEETVMTAFAKYRHLFKSRNVKDDICIDKDGNAWIGTYYEVVSTEDGIRALTTELGYHYTREPI